MVSCVGILGTYNVNMLKKIKSKFNCTYDIAMAYGQ